MRLDDPAAVALWARLQAFELDPPGSARSISTRIAQENGWTEAHVRRLVEEYRRFLLLTQVAGRPVSPSAAVDAVWHAHMLHSRDYWDRLCGGILGRPLHHDPNPGGEQEDARHRNQYRDTLEVYARVFGQAAPVDLWPRTPTGAPPPLDALGGDRDVLKRLLAGGFRPGLLALLCGGEARVTATALAGLHQRGLVAFVSGRPVPVVQATTGDDALTPEERAVWNELRRGGGVGPLPWPLALQYPDLVREATDEALWPTPEAHQQLVAERRAQVWRGVPLGLLTGLVLLLGAALLFDAPFLVLVSGVGLLVWAYLVRSVYADTHVKPTPRGLRLVEEFKRLVPRGTQVSLGSPLLTAVVAAGAIGAATSLDLAELQAAILPKASGSGDGGGGGCGGGCTGDGGGGGGGDGGDGGGGGCGGGD